MLHTASLRPGPHSTVPSLIPLSATHLKRAPRSKREGSLQVPLLCTPALTQFMVTDHHLFAPLTEAGIDVKSNVVASQKVDCEPVGNQS